MLGQLHHAEDVLGEASLFAQLFFGETHLELDQDLFARRDADGGTQVLVAEELVDLGGLGQERAIGRHAERRVGFVDDLDERGQRHADGLAVELGTRRHEPGLSAGHHLHHVHHRLLHGRRIAGDRLVGVERLDQLRVEDLHRRDDLAHELRQKLVANPLVHVLARDAHGVEYVGGGAAIEQLADLVEEGVNLLFLALGPLQDGGADAVGGIEQVVLVGQHDLEAGHQIFRRDLADRRLGEVREQSVAESRHRQTGGQLQSGLTGGKRGRLNRCGRRLRLLGRLLDLLEHLLQGRDVAFLEAGTLDDLVVDEALLIGRDVVEQRRAGGEAVVVAVLLDRIAELGGVVLAGAGGGELGNETGLDGGEHDGRHWGTPCSLFLRKHPYGLD